MSTVFHGYKIKKSDLWTVVDLLRGKVRKHYVYDHLKSLTCGEIDRATVETAVKIKLQLFEWGNKYYIFRILEDGYECQNIADSLLNEFSEPILYDDRSDICKNTKKNFEIVSKIDQLIEDGRYFIVNIRHLLF
jgi:hypothetical protein